MPSLGTIIVPAAGPATAALAFLAQSPGTVEEEEGEPLVGPAGGLLQEICCEVGIQWEATYRTNVFKRRLIEKDSDVVRLGVDQIRTKMVAELLALKDLRFIVTFGNEAMYCMTKQWGITKRRGTHWWWRDHPRSPLLLVTLHPSYVLRTHGAAKLNGKDPREWLAHDLRRLARRMGT